MKNNRKDSDQSQDSDHQNQVNTDNSSRPVPVGKLGQKLKTKKIVINISATQYPIIQQIADQLGWIVQRSQGQGDWDLWWTDREVQPQTLFRMHLYQRINHFPGIYVLARKNLLGLGLMAMKQYHPTQYKFFPETWALPLQFSLFRKAYETSPGTFIVKPQALSQGRGIFLTRKIQDVLNGNKYVVQRYVQKPLLMDGLKFDLRLYVLLGGTDPLRLYLYQEGLARFATEPYQTPNNQNMSRSYIHLTNYSLNKSNPLYQFNTSQKQADKGHKRSLSSVYARLQKNGMDVKKLKDKIEDAIIKTFISGLPSIRHQYQYCQPEQFEGNMCFHIIGVDVMLTANGQPLLLQINHTPSFQTNTPLDKSVKKSLIKDTIKLMRINQKNKRKHFERAKILAKNRLQTGKREIYTGKQRQQTIKQARNDRDIQEKDLLGNYKKIFPPQSSQKQQFYNIFYQSAVNINRDDCDSRKTLLNQQKKNDLKNKQSKKLRKISEIKQFRDYKRENKQYCINSNKEIPAHMLVTIQKTQNELISENINEYIQHVENVDKNIFRSKINKKLSNHSNQQLIKYTDSIKKFNQLMTKIAINKQILQQTHQGDCQTFSRLKQKITNKDGKTSSQGNYPLIKQIKLPMHLTPIIKPSEHRNGSFVKPKNYLLSDSKDFSQPKKNNQDDHHEKKNIRQISQSLAGVVVECRSTKTYGKLLKPGVGWGLSIKR